jgi:glutathione S-transferase
MILYDSLGPNPATVRLFIAETQHSFGIKVHPVDIMSLENRQEDYVNTVNSRGEVPALRLANGHIITEITAICEYLDEVSEKEGSLIGTTAEERAETRMWVRRVFLEICNPMTESLRNTEEFNAFYQGHRKLIEGISEPLKELALKGMERLNGELEGKTFIAGSRITLADILLFAFMGTLNQVIPWVLDTGFNNINKWYKSMEQRESAKYLNTAYLKDQIL